MTPPLRVVVIDDSPFICRLMKSFIESAEDLRVVATAESGERGLELVRELRPDVVTLDLEMPGAPGLVVLAKIMCEVPTPVVIVSGVSRKGADRTMMALERGAVDFILKYTPNQDTDTDVLHRDIVSKVRLAAGVKVIRSLAPGAAPSRPVPILRRPVDMPGERVVVIGASTGGPEAVRGLLAGLPEDFPASILVVQHLPAPFTQTLAAQLTRRTGWRCREASEGDRLQQGSVIVARGDRHVLVRREGRLELSDAPRVGGYRPSIDVAMQSAAEAFGVGVRGVVLTGMGNDGTGGLSAIRARGGRTYAQDEASCVVSSMPREAVAQGVVDRVASPAEIARLLCQEECSHGPSDPRRRAVTSDPVPVRR